MAYGATDSHDQGPAKVGPFLLPCAPPISHARHR